MATRKKDPPSRTLLPQHKRLVSASSISPVVARARGYRSIQTKAELLRLGFSNNQARVPALLHPIWGTTGEIILYQIRPDEPRILNGKAIKYETPRGARMALDIPPTIRKRIGNPKIPLWITEGIRKADAAVSRGMCCIALLGVWNWRGTNEFGGKVALPDWEYVALNDRVVYIVFDSDVMIKPEIHAALLRLKAFLETRKGRVFLVYLPSGPVGSKVGLDDFLAAGHTPDEVIQLSCSEPKVPLGKEDRNPLQEGPYCVTGGRICHVRVTQNGEVLVPLCNFSAQVIEELELDDGSEISRAFVLEGKLDTGRGLPTVRIPAERFSGMTWVTSSWGLKAVVAAGFTIRDRLREAIQRLSPEAVRRRIYQHTGWTKIGSDWRYLSASGAVGADGIEVDLGKELSRYSLPGGPENPREAMRTSLRLLEVADLTVTVPIWAAVFRAPLASAYSVDLTLWLEGPTGSLKSTLAALFLSHWGVFDRLNLPGTWNSTANSLAQRAFVLKDVLFVIDDYAPSGQDRREYEINATRLLRAQGNLAGRGRLRADLTERPGCPPRGLILGTGEQRPPGQSVLARTFLVELDRSAVHLDKLSAAQIAAPILPQAMAGYVSWLVSQMTTLPDTLQESFRSIRERAKVSGSHLRMPEALAHLWIGIDVGLTYAREVGACDSVEEEEFRARSWEALVARARIQERLVEEERPSRRFLEILGTVLTQRRATLFPKDNPGEGIRPETPLIGWQDDEFLYLLPDAAFQIVARFARETGEPFPVRANRLRQDLVSEGIAQPDPGRTTATVRLGGRVRRVLRLQRRSVSALLGEDLPGPLPVVTDVTGFGE